jgi:hypothetical protein
MANETCVGAVQTNLIRVARTLTAGYIDAGANNLYRTDSVIEIGSTPVYTEGSDLEQRNGSDVVCVAYKGPDSYKRHDLTMSLCTLDAELLEMLTGATVITSGGDSIGSLFPTDPNTNYICLEAWQTVIEDGEPTGEYVHWIWPRVRFRAGQTTRNNGILTVPLVGTAFANSNVGLGPAGDWPVAMTSPENWYVDTDLPTTFCGYLTASTGS